MAVVIISAILSIPQTAGGSNEYEVATAQCLAHTQSNCSGTITVGQNQYACAWNPSEGKCLVQQNSGASPICNPISPSGDQGYKTLLPYNQAITITYQNFFSVPNNGTLNCGDDGDQAAPYTCSGSPNGTCNANCSYTNSPADLAQVQLSNGSQQANCAASQIRFQYCGDGTCQSTPLENCPADTAYCNALGQHQTCETGACTNGCEFTPIQFGYPDGSYCTTGSGCTGGEHCVCDGTAVAATITLVRTTANNALLWGKRFAAVPIPL